MGLSVETLVVGPFGVNAHLVADEGSRRALLVDPGGDLDGIARLLESGGLGLEAIVATHAHIDHVCAAAEAKRRFGAPFCLHRDDAELLRALPLQARMFGFPACEVPEVDRWLADGDELPLGDSLGKVLYTPGHSPGGICLHFAEAKLLLTGDTLFHAGIGRTDLPGGSSERLLGAIRARLLPLGDEVRFLPGHGPGGLLGDERRSNPFLR